MSFSNYRGASEWEVGPSAQHRNSFELKFGANPVALTAGMSVSYETGIGKYGIGLVERYNFQTETVTVRDEDDLRSGQAPQTALNALMPK